MKILKIKIKLTRRSKEVIYNYPKEYNANKINVLAYSNKIIDNNVIYCIGIVEDKNADSFLLSEDIEEISKDEADTLGKMWRTPALKILDGKSVLAVINKIKDKVSLNEYEIKILDPNSKIMGINYTEEFNINNYLS